MKTMILLANGLEECEALITYDLLYRAGIQVELVGINRQVVSSHSVTIIPHKSINDIKLSEYDCLVLPGGMPGTRNLENDDTVQDIIDKFVQQDKYICAICAAPSILIHKGLINDDKFICYPGFEEDKKPANVKAIQDGKIITGKGLGAAFEFGHLIISNLVSKEKADEVLKQICY